MNPRFVLQVAILLVFAVAPRLSAAADKLTFEKDILPIFRAKCIRCHAGVEPKGKLNLTSPSALLTGGKSGPALRLAAAEFSLLYEKISSNKMPPVGQKLTAEEKGRIRKWINEGADGVGNAPALEEEELGRAEHWSFRPPVRPAVPATGSQDRLTNAIDAFVLKRLEENNLSLAPEADRLTLLRRAKFDLLGLPPTPDEVQEFLNDDAPGAHQRMVERLLASPRYGERWGRHWLDVAGFAESAGILSEDRPLPLTWRYRDYVIRALNEDLPYDRFLQEQIAGDELTNYWQSFESQERLPDDVIRGITATGFLRTAADPSRPDFKTIKNAAAQYFYPTLFDTVQIISSSTMGLTLQCARCHNHKFDPIPQVDYYRMQAVFMTAYRPENWVPQMNRRLKIASRKELQAAEKKNAEVDAQIKQLKAQQAELRAQFSKQLFDARLNALPVEIRADVQAAVDAKPAARTEVQKYLAEKFEKTLRPAGKELDAALNAMATFKQQQDKLVGAIQAAERGRWLFDEVRALYDLPGEATTPFLLRGDPLTPGSHVQPGVISTVETPEPFQYSPPAEGAKTSGRRLAFARWLTQPGHPLTSRVMVNRLWMHHFGVGLVATPDDFGVAGDPPSHPLLLDWLATELVRSGWSLKHIHRLILNSSTWRQRSRVTESARTAGEQQDPDNRLLWRQSLRRLEAESLRDAVLAVAGELDGRIHGRSHAVARQKNGEVTVPTGRHRRSIYIQVLRLNPETMLEVFDQPTMSVNCNRRSVSTVSTQALTMLNSDTMVNAAKSFANRVAEETGADALELAPARAILIALGRPPSASEGEVFQKFFQDQTARHLEQAPLAERELPESFDGARRAALTDLCHMLMSANEFLYID